MVVDFNFPAEPDLKDFVRSRRILYSPTQPNETPGVARRAIFENDIVVTDYNKNWRTPYAFDLELETIFPESRFGFFLLYNAN